MKPLNPLTRITPKCIATLLTACSLLIAEAPSLAASLYWDGGTVNNAAAGNSISEGGNGIWNTTIQNWDNGAVPHVAWAGGSDAEFGGGSYFVTNSADLITGQLVVNNAGTNFLLADTVTPIRRITVTGVTIASGATLQLGNVAGSTTFSAPQLVLGGDITGSGQLLLKGARLMSDSSSPRAVTLPAIGIRQGDGSRAIQFGDAINTGTITVTGTFDVDASGRGIEVVAGCTAICVGSLGGAGTLTKGGPSTSTGALIWDGDITYSGATTISFGTLQIGNGGTTGTVAGNITDNASLVFNRSDDYTYAGVVSGSGSLTKQGAGRLTLDAANTYVGATTISGGTLAVGAFGSLASTFINVGAGSVFDVASQASFSLNTNQTLAGGGSVNGNLSTASNTAVLPGGALVIGTLTFSNDLSLIDAALTFDLTGSTTAGSGVNDLIQMSGGSLITSGTVKVSLTGNYGNGTYTLIQGAGPTTYAGIFTITNPRRGTYTFDTTTTPGSVLLVISGLSAGVPVVWQGNTSGDWDTGVSLNWTNNSGSPDKFYAGDPVSFNDSAITYNVTNQGVLQPGSFTVNAASNYLITGSGKISGATGLTKEGSGALRIGSANDFSGNVVINNGILAVANAAACGDTNGITIVTNTGTFDLAGISSFLTGDRLIISGAGLNNTGAVINTGIDVQSGIRSLTLAADASVGAWANATTRWDVRGTGGAGSFNGELNLNGFTYTKIGPGTNYLVDVTAGNPGDIVVQAGTLGIARSWVTNSGTIQMGSNILHITASATAAQNGDVTKPITFDSGGRITQVSGVAYGFSAPVTINGPITVDVASSGTLTLSNAVTGAGGLTKITAGALRLESASPYFGNTTISAGTLALGPLGSIANTPAILLGSGATFNPSAAGSFTLASGRNISGGGSTAGVLVGNLTMDAGSSMILGAVGSFGSLTISTNVTMNGGSLAFDLNRVTSIGGGNNDLLTVGTNLTVAGTVQLNISGYPTNGSYVIITNTSGTRTVSSGGFVLNNLTRANLTLDTSNARRVLVTAVTNPPASLVWRGDGINNIWNAAINGNWVSNGVAGQVFFNGDIVVFDDSGSNSPAINVQTPLFPGSVLVTNSVGTYTFGGAGFLTGPASLVKSGAGSLVVLSNHSLTGPTVINAGSVQVGNGGPGGFLGTGSISNSGTLTFFRSDSAAVAIANVISGSGALGFTGTGVSGQSPYTLSGVNTFTGPVNLSLARIQNATDATRFGNPSMINVPAGSAVFCATASTFPQRVSIAGQGWQELTAPNYLGAIRFSGSTWSGPITLTGNARIAGHNANGTVTGPVSGAYELEIAATSGSSTFTMSSTNSSASTKLSVLASATSLTVTLGNSNGLSSGPLTLTNGVTLRLNGNSASFAGISSLGGRPQIHNGGASPATLTVGSGGGSAVFGGILTNGGAGALALAKVGAGTLTLSATNPYTGGTTISAGTLALASTGDLPNSTPITVAPGAQLDVAASLFTLGAGRTLNAGRSSAFATDIQGPLTSAGTLQPGASGNAGTMTISGGLNLDGGTISLDLTNTPTAGGGVNDLIVVSGPLNLSGTTTITANWLGNKVGSGTYKLIEATSLASGSAAANLVLGSGLISGGRATYALDDTTTPGTIYLVVTGTPAQLVWTGANGSTWDDGVSTNWLNVATPDAFFSGDFAVFNDGPVADQTISVLGALGAGGITFSNNVRSYTFNDGGSASLQTASLSKPGTGNVTVATPLEVSGAVSLSAGSLILAPASGASNVLSGPVSGAGTLVKDGDGQAFLSAANAGFSGSVVLAQGELIARNNNALGTSPVTIGSVLTGPAETSQLTIDTGVSITNVVVVETNALDATIAGEGAIGGAASLTKGGLGILKVGNKNTYTGSTTVSAGTVQLDVTNALAAGSTIFLGDTNSATNSITLRIGPSAVSGTVGAASPIIVSSNAPSAVITLDNNPASTAVCVNSGTITLQNHALWITNSGGQLWQLNGKITGTGNVHVDVGSYGRRVRFNYSGSDFAGDVFIVTGGIQTGNGSPGSSVDAIPNNSDVFMSAGTTLGLGASDTIGALNGGAPDSVNTNSAIVKPNISGAGTQILTLGNNGHSGTFDGNMTDEPGNHLLRLTKTGAGTQTLNGDCSFTGTTTVSGGTLLINSNYNSVITVSSGATLGGNGLLNSNVTVSAGGYLSPGTSIGALNLNANLTLNGNMLVEVQNAPSLTNDFVNVLGVLAGSGVGTITVTNLNPGSPLVAGNSFTLLSQPLPTGGSLTITPEPGAGLAWQNRLAIDGSIVVVAGVSTVPTNIVSSVSGGNLEMSWPASHIGWRLESQTNSLSVGLNTNWFTVPASTATNAVTIPINGGNPAVFFRLVYP